MSTRGAFTPTTRKREFAEVGGEIFRQSFNLAFAPSIPFFGGDLPDFGR
jgi:hypothetical protein